jgi:hypothetical protein
MSNAISADRPGRRARRDRRAAMSWMDRLRAMLGGGAGEPPQRKADPVQEELAEERVEHDLEHAQEEAIERRIATPTTLDD